MEVLARRCDALRAAVSSHTDEAGRARNASSSQARTFPDQDGSIAVFRRCEMAALSAGRSHLNACVKAAMQTMLWQERLCQCLAWVLMR